MRSYLSRSILLIVFLLTLGCKVENSAVFIENLSSFYIKRIEIEDCGTTAVLKHIPKKTRQGKEYIPNKKCGESTLNIKVEFEKGGILERNIGYTDGTAQRYSLMVNDNEITLGSYDIFGLELKSVEGAIIK